MSCKNVESNTQLNEYVTELDYDLVDGQQMDTYIKIEAERICISGKDIRAFADRLQRLIDSYRI